MLRKRGRTGFRYASCWTAYAEQRRRRAGNSGEQNSGRSFNAEQAKDAEERRGKILCESLRFSASSALKHLCRR